MNNENTNQDGMSKIDLSIKELAEKLQAVMKEHAADFSKKEGREFMAGILPYMQNQPDGSFKPMAKVVMLPVKQVEENAVEQADAPGESERSGTESGDEPTQ